MKKTTNNLSIQALTAKYDVAACGVAKFDEALHDGTILEAIRASAEANLGGQMLPAIRQLKKNCASQRCHRKDRDVVTTADANIDKMVDMFDEFLSTLVEIEGGASRSKVRFYSYTKEQMEAMDAGQLKALDNCLRSWYTNNGYTVDQVVPEKVELFNQVSAWAKVFNEIKADKSNKPTKVEVSDKLLGKLSAGKAANLSKAEAAELAALLQKLQG